MGLMLITYAQKPPFNLYSPIKFFIKFNALKSIWSIVNIEVTGYHEFHTNIVFISLKIYSVSANSADPDEMPHYVVFHLGLHCVQKYPLMFFPIYKGL